MHSRYIPLLSLLLCLLQASFALDAAGPASEVSRYSLASGDLIKIHVYGEEELTVEVRLSDAGTIIYPFLGELELAGKTIGEVEQAVTDGLKGRYLVNPRVSVKVDEYRQFYVNGSMLEGDMNAIMPGWYYPRLPDGCSASPDTNYALPDGTSLFDAMYRANTAEHMLIDFGYVEESLRSKTNAPLDTVFCCPTMYRGPPQAAGNSWFPGTAGIDDIEQQCRNRLGRVYHAAATQGDDIVGTECFCLRGRKCVWRKRLHIKPNIYIAARRFDADHKG